MSNDAARAAQLRRGLYLAFRASPHRICVHVLLVSWPSTQLRSAHYVSIPRWPGHHEKSRVLQCLPESHDGCVEVLDEVVEYLCQRFPNKFDRIKRGNATTIRNKITGETFVFGTENDNVGPLEIAVRLTMEDLSILMTNADGKYYLLVCSSASADPN